MEGRFLSSHVECLPLADVWQIDLQPGTMEIERLLRITVATISSLTKVGGYNFWEAGSGKHGSVPPQEFQGAAVRPRTGRLYIGQKVRGKRDDLS
jgi:hypothetical protein